MSFVPFVVINTLHKLFARHPLIIMARKGSIKKRTERSDLNKYSIFNLQSSIPSLFFDIRYADRGWWGGSADGAGQYNDGEHIGNHIDKLGGHHLR